MLKRMKTMLYVLSDCSRSKLEVIMETVGKKKNTNSQRSNNNLLNNTQLKEDMVREIFKYFELSETENTTYVNCSESST